MTLTDRLYQVLAEVGSDVGHPVNVMHRFPGVPEDEVLTAFELDCKDWGFVYGMAYGIARSEDPWEADGQAAERALVAARDAFARWGGTDIFSTASYRNGHRAVA
jgi:hypothetical protein